MSHFHALEVVARGNIGPVLTQRWSIILCSISQEGIFVLICGKSLHLSVNVKSAEHRSFFYDN